MNILNNYHIFVGQYIHHIIENQTLYILCLPEQVWFQFLC